VNSNPWCYTFHNTGTLIFSPPSGFCGSYFSCISGFWNGNGFVVECQDGQYSKDGGRSGVCAGDGGVNRNLYAP
jgi:hypothetical protein